MAQRIEYSEITRAKVNKNRNVVISSCSKGGYTVAQQIVVNEDDGTQTNLFLKGAIHIDDVESLEALRDALTVAINDAKEWEN